jgi:site-specific recombinase XerC
MANGQSREDLLQFLDYLGSKGLMNPQTASARKASANTLLGILPKEEVMDVTKLDLESVTQRFMNLKGSEFKPDSVRVYKSRVAAAIRDFASYKKDPLSFKPQLEQRASKTTEKKNKAAAAAFNQVSHANVINPSPAMQTEGIVFPIPLRADITIKIAGIPADMSQSEAKRICNVLMALAVPEEL